MPIIGQPVFSAWSMTLTIFSPIHLAERTAVDGEVLAEHADRPAVDRAVASHHAVAVWPVPRHAEIGSPVPGKLVELGEGARVQQRVDPLARGHLALGVLALDLPARCRRGSPHNGAAPGRQACRRWSAGPAAPRRRARRSSAASCCGTGSVAMPDRLGQNRQAYVTGGREVWPLPHASVICLPR